MATLEPTHCGDCIFFVPGEDGELEGECRHHAQEAVGLRSSLDRARCEDRFFSYPLTVFDDFCDDGAPKNASKA